VPDPVIPSLAEHFLGNEMEAIAAYVYRYQGYEADPKNKTGQCLPGKYFTDMMAERPWEPIERLRIAIRFLNSYKDGKKFSFLNSEWNEKVGNLVLTGKVNPNETKQAFKVYKDIINWNDDALKAYAEKHGSTLEKEFGFTEQKIAPFEKERPTSAFSMTPSAPVMEPDVVRRGPGRPPKISVD